MKPYYAVAMQPRVIGACIDENAHSKNVTHMCELIDRAVDATAQTMKGHTPKLIGFPESFLHGFGPARKRTHITNSRMARPMPGEETGRLGEKAKEHGCYIAGSMFEIDKDYPGHFFNTGFIIDPEGEIALKYRKINCSNSAVELSTSPGDIMARFDQSLETLFPVLKTPIGNLATYICFDGMFPEMPRCFALMGAEVLIRPMGPQPTSGAEYVDIWRMGNRMRAFENNVYVVGPHWADSPQTESLVSEGHSMIVDFNGRILTESSGTHEHFVVAPIDIQALRRRRKNERNNFLAQLRSELYARVYAAKACFPSGPQTNRERGFKDLDEKWAYGAEVFRDLVNRGIYTDPED